ncbi:hypothetical protein [Bacillus sp. LL01]|uniref:hypothetical protein n=1 Tax=Bacillus sp. LL01 TaxID=1665556 RepID=UPI0018E3B0F3|nr:hypothetical protein [Bacillus sp. LL01]
MVENLSFFIDLKSFGQTLVMFGQVHRYIRCSSVNYLIGSVILDLVFGHLENWFGQVERIFGQVRANFGQL